QRVKDRVDSEISKQPVPLIVSLIQTFKRSITISKPDVDLCKKERRHVSQLAQLRKLPQRCFGAFQLPRDPKRLTSRGHKLRIETRDDNRLFKLFDRRFR